jgi:hypothetical protein
MKFAMLSGAVLAAFLSASPAAAGVFTDDLTRCIVKSTTDGDRRMMVRFIFAAMSADADLQSLSTVTPGQRADVTKAFAGLVQRLILTDCRKEAVAAEKNEGAGVYKASFDVLGRSAMQGLITSPGTQSALKDIANYLDKDGWTKFEAEAGGGAAK